MKTEYAYFLTSSSFCQLGNSLFKRSKPLQIRGSPKKPKPTKNMFIFINMADVATMDMAMAGTRRLASLSCVVILGNGDVGESALEAI